MTDIMIDPEKRPTGTGKQIGGWFSWLIGLGSLAAILTAWALTR